MNDYRITYMPRARSDLLDISAHAAFVSFEPDISGNFIQGLKKSISYLTFFPYMFPLVHEKISHREAVRRMPYKNYHVYYEINEIRHTVIILRIISAKRDPRSL